MRRRRVLLTLGTLCLLAALALTVWNVYSESHAQRAAAQTLRALEPMIEAAAAEAPSSDIAPAEPAEEEPAAEPAVIPDYVLNPQMEMPVTRVGGVDYIGVLDIPALELTLPVASAWSYETLHVAPCRYAGSAYLDDLVILAHNYRGFFRDLPQLHTGDDVSFIDADGNLFRYTIADFEQLRPSQHDDMISGDWDLTLFTCTVGGQNRLALRCVRKTEP